jgi:hypothetical protein
MLGDLDRERAELLLRPISIWEASGVAQIQVVLGGQRDEKFMEHGEAADSGIEHANGMFGEHGHLTDGARGGSWAPVRLHG